jgi:predicted small lipoprotein YifL
MIGHHLGMYSRPLFRTMLPLVAVSPLLFGCGNKGDLYHAADDPARAELDARGKGEPFPFPPKDAEWPPPAEPPEEPAPDAAAGSAPTAAP